MNKQTLGLGLSALVVVGVAALWSPNVTRATETDTYDTVFHPDDVSEGLVRDLMRIFISEADFNDPVEHAALGHTLARRARRLRRVRGWPARRTLRTIADRALVSPLTDRQHWLHALDLSGTRPDGWSRWTTAAWTDSRADGLRAAIEEARALVRGDLEDPCNGPSELWGSRTHPVDSVALRNNIRSGTWVVVDCGLAPTPDNNVYVRWGTRAERRNSPAVREARRRRRREAQVTYVY